MQQVPIGCVTEATRVLGDKWTPHLLRFLINEEVVRFCQIQDLAVGINPRTLSARLEQLNEQGLIEKVTPEDTSRCEYRITDKGRSFAPILREMEAWDARFALVS